MGLQTKEGKTKAEEDIFLCPELRKAGILALGTIGAVDQADRIIDFVVSPEWSAVIFNWGKDKREANPGTLKHRKSVSKALATPWGVEAVVRVIQSGEALPDSPSYPGNKRA